MFTRPGGDQRRKAFSYETKESAFQGSHQAEKASSPEEIQASVAPSEIPSTKPAATSLTPPAASSQPEPGEKRPTGPLPYKIPPILLEGDEPSTTSFPAAPQKFALGPGGAAPGLRAESELRELPEAYGTCKMLLTARDPHTLYTHWDFTEQQQRGFNAQSRDHHLVVRVHRERLQSAAVSEVHVHPESRHWFIHVDHAATKYVVELGYHRPDGSWVSVASSGTVATPPAVVSEDKTVRFATLEARPVPSTPAHVTQHHPPARPLPEYVPAPWPDSPRPAIPGASFPAVPPTAQGDWGPGVGSQPGPEYIVPADFTPPAETWTPAQELALSEEINFGPARREWANSLELAELMKIRLQPQPLAEFISSPFGGEQPKERAFWFNINAELIIYGATEPDATVMIGDRKIRLRPDGTFSYRFAFPDGNYQLPVSATSTDNDVRRAALRFSRGTEYSGEVGAHPQDKALKPPLVDNVG